MWFLSKFKRSEFWLALAATIGGFLQLNAPEPLAQAIGGIMVCVGSGSYIHSRGQAKKKNK